MNINLIISIPKKNSQKEIPYVIVRMYGLYSTVKRELASGIQKNYPANIKFGISPSDPYSSFHNGGPLVSERSVRNPKILTAGFKVKSKNKTLKIPYLVRIRLMGSYPG